MTAQPQRNDVKDTVQRRRNQHMMSLEDDASLELSVDQITAMRLQEETSYKCPDYLSADWLYEQQIQQQQRPPLHKMVEECANIVTDMSLWDNNDAYLRSRAEEEREGRSPPNGSHNKDLKDIASPRQGTETSPSSAASPPCVSATSRRIAEDAAQVRAAEGVLQEGRRQTSIEGISNLSCWRQQMCSWSYQAVDAFGFDRDVVAVAFSFLDRYLAKECSTEVAAAGVEISKEEYQLISMTALFTAIKITEPKRKLSVEALIDMSRGFFSADDVSAMEMDILMSLQWKMNPPTALAFVGLYLDLLPVTKVQREDILFKCRRLTELAVNDSFFISRNASSVAIASILLAGALEDDTTSALPSNIPEHALDDFVANVKRLTKVDVRSMEVTTVRKRLQNLYI